MPGGDRTGPYGFGPMTGRSMGYCSGYAMPGYANAGFGWGRGRGYRKMYCMTGLPGWARGAYPYGSVQYGAAGAVKADEKEILQEQADFLEKQLQEVRERLEGLEKEE
jgi:hypothetical protein